MLSIINLLLFGFEMAGVLIIVWIGWLRTKRVAYLILGAWALAAIAGMGFNYLPVIRQYFGGGNNGQSIYQMMMWINLVRTLVSSVLLLTGLGMLVFLEPRARPKQES